MLWIIYAIWLIFIVFCVWLTEKKQNEIGTFLFIVSLVAVLYAPMIVK